jgi:dihydroorotase-like cyclic amidohydrolase
MSSKIASDLVVKGGTALIPGVGRIRADIAVTNGKIVAIGENLSGDAIVDAAGKLVIPGIFDPHTHIGNEQSFDEEAETETRAAILGGVTTIGIFIRSLKDSYLKHLPGFRKAMDERSYVDSIFHPQLFNDEQISEIPAYVRDYGIRSFKFYMSGLPGIVDSVPDDLLLRGFRAVAAVGPDAIACVHCETGSLIAAARDALAKKPNGTLADWTLAHPPEAEALAIQTALYLAQVAGAHLYVVHLSSSDGLEVVRQARRQGLNFTVETTTTFLGINDRDPNGFLAKAVPPVRPPSHQEALWDGIAEGSINTIGTDNTSRTRAGKKPDAGLHGSRPGLPLLGTHLPALLHFGRQHGIPLETLIDGATRSPARVFGLYPRKGTIAIGSDADLVVVDLDLEKTVRAADLRGMSDFSPFEGKTLKGWPVVTIKNGVVIARDGEIVGKSNGRYLLRAPQDAPSLHWLKR